MRAGEVIAYPTEAVFGLGCDPKNAHAVAHILRIKQRPPEAGLILIGADMDHLEEWIEQPEADLMSRALGSWPGPVTWLFPKSCTTPRWLSGAHETIAVRLTEHPVCRALCAAFGGAIVSTSANPCGAPPAVDHDMLHEYFKVEISGIVGGELGGHTKPSEIRDLATGQVIRSV